MKILHFIYQLSPGGAERFVVDLTNELSNQGHDVTLCILRDDTLENFGFYKGEISEKVNYINLKIPAGLRFNNIAVLFKLVKRIKPQIVHCHLNLVNYIFPLTFIFPRVKFFQTIHDDAKKEVKNNIEYRIRLFFYKNLKVKAITISAETSYSFEAYYKIPPFKEIYNGRVNPEPSAFYTDIKKEIQNFKEKGNTVFIHIGRCSVQKNQLMLISVFNKLILSGNQIVLLIIGSGFDSDEGQKLKEVACDKIFFLGEKHNISDYLLNADAFCLSSIHEGMPISLIEAFACGCIPICTPVGGMINIIDNGITGFISKSVSEADYLDAMEQFLDCRQSIDKTKLVKFYRDNLTIEQCAMKYIKLYAE